MGAAALDIIVEVENFPREDEIVFPCRGPQRLPGGSTANIAVGAARLGLKSSFLGKLGSDEAGELLKKDFLKEGVDIQGVLQETGSSSAQTFIAVNKRGERVMYSLGGKCLLEEESEIAGEVLEDTAIFYVGEAFPALGELAVKKASQGATVIYGPGGLFSGYGFSNLAGIIRRSDYVILSKPELIALSGCVAPEEGIKKLLKAGVKNLLLTRGKEGSALFSQEEEIYVPAYKTDVVDTTGAGDAFTAGFMYSIYRKKDHKTALAVGNASAAMAVTKTGARAGLPYLEQLQEFLHRNNVRLE